VAAYTVVMVCGSIYSCDGVWQHIELWWCVAAYTNIS